MSLRDDVSPLRASDVLQTVIGECSSPPALKCGVTANIAFQASYALRAVRTSRAMIEEHLIALCVPLRALEWGYDCFALRALSLFNA